MTENLNGIKVRLAEHEAACGVPGYTGGYWARVDSIRDMRVLLNRIECLEAEAQHRKLKVDHYVDETLEDAAKAGERIKALEAALEQIRDKPPLSTTSENTRYVRGYNRAASECRRIARQALED